MHSRALRTTLVAVASSTLCGCPQGAPFPAPPPETFAIEGVGHESSGSTSVAAYSGGVGVNLTGVGVGEVPIVVVGGRVAHRFNDRYSLGFGGLSTVPTGLGSGRVFLRVDPPIENLAIVIGAGGGAVGEHAFGTLDAGLRAGFLTLARRLEFYASATAAESLAIERLAGRTPGLFSVFYLTGDLGVIVRPDPHWSVGLDAFYSHGFGTRWAGLDLFGGTLSLRVSFGEGPATNRAP